MKKSHFRIPVVTPYSLSAPAQLLEITLFITILKQSFLIKHNGEISA